MKINLKLAIVVALVVILVGGFYLGTLKGESTPSFYTVEGEDLVIDKSAITSTASFIPYEEADNYMEIIAIKASDGSIRTALNTCQVCFDSGRGYYEQSGDLLICNNCKNQFSIDDIEVVRDGCNPIPITGVSKSEDDTNITISGAFLKENNFYFARWEK